MPNNKSAYGYHKSLFTDRKKADIISLERFKTAYPAKNK
jgi:hypothetical protein